MICTIRFTRHESMHLRQDRWECVLIQQFGSDRFSAVGDPAPLRPSPESNLPAFTIGTVFDIQIVFVISRLSGFFSLGAILPVVVRSYRLLFILIILWYEICRVV